MADVIYRIMDYFGSHTVSVNTRFVAVNGFFKISTEEEKKRLIDGIEEAWKKFEELNVKS